VNQSNDRLSVTTSAGGWTLVGEIDAFTSADLAEAFGHVPAVADGVIEVDVAGVTFIDSSGLRVLIGLTDRVATAGGRVALRNPSGPVSKILEITGLESTFGLG
jgi:anti-sigma B factor antagonist